MSEEIVDDAFMALTDAFVQMANENSSEMGSVKAGAALLFAATRFNAFVVASRSRDIGELKADRDIALSHFSDQHAKMLAENLDDYEENFDRYITKYRTV